MKTTKFYSVSHNSLVQKGFPWIKKIVTGQVEMFCSTCQNPTFYPSGEISITLEPNKGVLWPDVLGCGDGLLFIVSEKVLKDWENEGFKNLPFYRIKILEPIPPKLKEKGKPEYFWLDGKRLKGALLDFVSSGFVNPSNCAGCGRLFYDVKATYDRQVYKESPYVFKPNSWKDQFLFTTDLSDLSFFCTETILNFAQKYAHTNFRFIPIADGIGTESKGVNYLEKHARTTNQPKSDGQERGGVEVQ